MFWCYFFNKYIKIKPLERYPIIWYLFKLEVGKIIRKLVYITKWYVKKELSKSSQDQINETTWKLCETTYESFRPIVRVKKRFYWSLYKYIHFKRQKIHRRHVNFVNVKSHLCFYAYKKSCAQFLATNNNIYSYITLIYLKHLSGKKKVMKNCCF